MCYGHFKKNGCNQREVAYLDFFVACAYLNVASFFDVFNNITGEYCDNITYKC